MQNILTIYKFQFPFFDIWYEKVKCETFISNLKDFLVYEEVNLKINQKMENEAVFSNLFFDFWKVEIIYYDNNDYFVPLFRLDLFLNNDVKNEFKEKIFHKIYNINKTFWDDEFIFDIDESYLDYRKEDVLSLDDLDKNFKLINENDLKTFLLNIKKDFLEDYLETNYKIKYYLYYIIYLCYIFYYNSILLNESKKELENISWSSNFNLYNWHIDLQNIKIKDLQDINIVQFKKYFTFLKKFFSLIK